MTRRGSGRARASAPETYEALIKRIRAMPKATRKLTPTEERRLDALELRLLRRDAKSAEMAALGERWARENVEKKLAGRPPKGNKVAARTAYERAIQAGSKVEAAILEAMAAGGFKSASRVYELKKAEGW